MGLILFYLNQHACQWHHCSYVFINIYIAHVFCCLFIPLQKLNVVDQEKIDKIMIELDGTENKCEHIRNTL